MNSVFQWFKPPSASLPSVRFPFWFLNHPGGRKGVVKVTVLLVEGRIQKQVGILNVLAHGAVGT